MTFVLAVGRPNVFTDTRDYMIHGARFYQALRRTFLGEKEPVPKTPEEQKAWQRLQWQMHFDHSNVGARSPYYGIFLYTLAHRGTLWLLSIVQSLACAWLLFLLWRSIAAEAPGWTYYALMAALSLGSSLPWVASFAMPDIFAAVLILSAALLLFYRRELTKWETAGACVLLGASVAFHGSHVLLILALAPVGFLIGTWLKADRPQLRTYVRIAVGAVVIAIAANSIYAAAVRLKTGDPLRRPPFLMARVMADGPGRAYLRHSCAQGATWVVCPFRNLPLDDSDQILWSAKPENGVFNRSGYEDRVLMEKQETDFVIDTFLYDPIGQFAASMRNWGLQLVNFYVDDPLRRPLVFIVHNYWGHTNLVGLLRGVGPCGQSGELCEPRVQISDLEILDNTLVGACLLGLIAALCQRRALLGAVQGRRLSWDDPLSRASAVCLFITAAIVINAGVCGAIAGVFARYQSRVVWLLPAETMLLALALVPARSWAQLKTSVGLDSVDLAWGRLTPTVHAAALEAARFRRRTLARAFQLKAGALERIDPALLRFGVVGVVGFVVDATILNLLVHGAGLNDLLAQLPAFGVAVVITWLLNRAWTFRSSKSDSRVRQAALYFGVQCAGAAANFAVYSSALYLDPALERWLVVPLAFGAVAGLCLTFLGSKYLAFRQVPSMGSGAAAVADTPAA